MLCASSGFSCYPGKSACAVLPEKSGLSLSFKGAPAAMGRKHTARNARQGPSGQLRAMGALRALEQGGQDFYFLPVIIVEGQF